MPVQTSHVWMASGLQEPSEASLMASWKGYESGNARYMNMRDFTKMQKKKGNQKFFCITVQNLKWFLQFFGNGLYEEKIHTQSIDATQGRFA